MASFPKFGELALELREIIWEEALPGPRTVYLEKRFERQHNCSRVWSNASNTADGNNKFWDVRRLDVHPWEENNRPRLYYYRSSSPSPIIYANGESYRISKQFYTLVFGTESMPPRTWFNFKQDTLCLNVKWYQRHRYHSPIPIARIWEDLSEDALEVQNLALLNHTGLRLWNQGDYFGAMEGCVATVLDRFRHVQNLSLAIAHYGFPSTAEIAFIDKEEAFTAEPYPAVTEPDCDPYHPILLEHYPELENIPQLFEKSPVGAFFISELEMRRTMMLNEEMLPRWDMPKIEIKLLSTTAWKASYMLEKEQYDSPAAARQRRRVLLASPRFKTLDVHVHHRTTIGDLVALFRKKIRVPDELDTEKIIGAPRFTEGKNAHSMARVEWGFGTPCPTDTILETWPDALEIRIDIYLDGDI